MSDSLTQCQLQVDPGCRSNDLWPQEVVEQHLQAQQLDGGEAVAGLLAAAAAAEVQAWRVGRAVEAHCIAWGKGLEIQHSVKHPLHPLGWDVLECQGPTQASVTTGCAR